MNELIVVIGLLVIFGTVLLIPIVAYWQLLVRHAHNEELDNHQQRIEDNE